MRSHCNKNRKLPAAVALVPMLLLLMVPAPLHVDGAYSSSCLCSCCSIYDSGCSSPYPVVGNFTPSTCDASTTCTTETCTDSYSACSSSRGVVAQCTANPLSGNPLGGSIFSTVYTTSAAILVRNKIDNAGRSYNGSCFNPDFVNSCAYKCSGALKLIRGSDEGAYQVSSLYARVGDCTCFNSTNVDLTVRGLAVRLTGGSSMNITFDPYSRNYSRCTSMTVSSFFSAAAVSGDSSSEVYACSAPYKATGACMQDSSSITSTGTAATIHSYDMSADGRTARRLANLSVATNSIIFTRNDSTLSSECRNDPDVMGSCFLLCSAGYIMTANSTGNLQLTPTIPRVGSCICKSPVRVEKDDGGNIQAVFPDATVIDIDITSIFACSSNVNTGNVPIANRYCSMQYTVVGACIPSGAASATVTIKVVLGLVALMAAFFMF